MNNKDEKTGDIFGIAAYGEALNTLARGVVEGAGAFLSRICLPAAEEFGFLLRDKISAWRGNNAINIALKAETKFSNLSKGEKLHAHPRLVMKVLEHGSWIDDEKVQEMWSGLLVSSCTEDGQDETNLIFMNILSQITSVQAAILNYACVNSEKSVSNAGWLLSEVLLMIDLRQLCEITGIDDFHRLDRELDHLRALGLIGGGYSGGFREDSTEADITPAALALQMYVRCQGYKGSPVEFFGLEDKIKT
jgi:hypothetical protein